MTADNFNIEPVGNLRKIDSANAFKDQNAPKKKMAKKEPKSQEQQQDDILEDNLGCDDQRHLIDYKA